MAVFLSTNIAPPPQGSTPAEALGLRAGQVVEALVASSSNGGKAQLAIANQVVEAALQARLQTGLLIRLLVQGTGANTRLTVLPVQNGLQQAQPPATAQAAAGQGQGASRPQTPVQVPPPSRPAVQATPGRSQPVPVQARSTGPAQSAVQTPDGNAAPAHVQSVQAGSAVSPAQGVPQAQSLATRLQNPVSLPGAASRAAVAGRVAPVVPLGTATVSQPPSQPAAGQLAPGTVLQLKTLGAGTHARPVLVQVNEPQAVNQPAQLHNLPAVNTPGPLQQAVVQTVQSLVFRQDSISALLTSLAGLGSKLSELPKPVAQAGAELLAARLELGAKPLDGAALKQALTRSGVLLETTLSKPAGPPVQPGDIKAALLKLGDALRLWLGDGTQSRPGSEQRPPPPAQGSIPRAERPANLPLPPNLSNTEAGARLLVQTDAALARLRLTQISSLPDTFARGPQGSAPAPELNMELPLLLGGELSIGQFQILRDGGKEGARDDHEFWKMRFSVNFSQTGEVGATVSLRRRKIGVMLWAEREDMAEMLEEMTPELERMLAARGLEPGSIRCRHGHPPRAKRPVGAYVDNSS